MRALLSHGSRRRAVALAILLYASSLVQGAIFDGPYVMRNADGDWEVWTAEIADAGLVRKVTPAVMGTVVTTAAVGGRPPVNVPLRMPEKPGPDEIELTPGVPVFLMADSHGQFEIATELLIRQKIIDASLRWRFGKGHLVVLGDVFDRGPNHTEIFWLLYKLEADARGAGGDVHLVLGNHETMILNGDLRYLHSRYAQSTKVLGVPSYAELWSGQSLLGRWLRTKPTVLRLGRILCVHGGISSAMTAGNWAPARVNNTVRRWLEGVLSEDDPGVGLLTGATGPLWYRGYFEDHAEPGQGLRSEIDEAKAFYRVDRIVIGHTIRATITPLYDGEVIALNVNMARNRDGSMTAEGVLIDQHGNWHRAGVDGARERILSLGTRLRRTKP